jgi:hypothetical protein
MALRSLFVDLGRIMPGYCALGDRRATGTAALGT